jgi:CrcB protein
MILWIGLGGAVGSILRYVLGGAIQKAGGMPFPLGTLVINVTGCFIIGALSQHYMGVQTHPQMRTALITGFCGGYTTFSAFSLETVGLMRGGEYEKAGLYVLLSVVVSLAATIAGMAAVKAAA